MAITVFCVDKYPLIRYGFATLVASNPRDFVLWRESWGVEDSVQAFHAFGEAQGDYPRIVVTELYLDFIKELTQNICPDNKRLSVIVYTSQEMHLFGERALRAGARGFVEKTADPRELVHAMKVVASGRIALSLNLNDRLLARVTTGGNHRADTKVHPVETLSDRELEVFEKIGRGFTTRAIAASLFLSPKTVETYRENIKAKLNLKNAVELTQNAVQWVLERGQT